MAQRLGWEVHQPRRETGGGPFYGHPDAGTYWEQSWEKSVSECGFQPVDGWRSAFWHPGERALLVVYVDDFNLAAPKGELAGIWKGLRSRILMDEPGPAGRFLGCYRKEFEVPISCAPIEPILANHPRLHPREGDSLPPPTFPAGETVRGYLYDMQAYAAENARKYLSQTKSSAGVLRKVGTPFVDEAKFAQGCSLQSEVTTDARGKKAPRGGVGAATAAADDAAPAAPGKAKKKPSPTGAAGSATADAGGAGTPAPGQLNTVGASITMTTMYMARIARMDLLRAVGSMATQLTKWTEVTDKQLLRLISYVHCSQGSRSVGFIGDDPKDLELALYTDADFAGDQSNMKSTIGIIIALIGPCSFYPLSGVSKKHGAQSNSTAEAELVAAFDALRLEGIPALDLWELILGRMPKMTLWEDNQACSAMIKSGKFPTLRHVKRMHGVSITWLHDAYKNKIFQLGDCHTERQAADIFTKHFVSKDNWQPTSRLIGLVVKGILSELIMKTVKKTSMAQTRLIS